jgi:hypothetical protein
MNCEFQIYQPAFESLLWKEERDFLTYKICYFQSYSHTQSHAKYKFYLYSCSFLSEWKRIFILKKDLNKQ